MSKKIYLTAEGTGDGRTADTAGQLDGFSSSLDAANGPGGAVFMIFPSTRETFWAWEKTQARTSVTGAPDAPFLLAFVTSNPPLAESNFNLAPPPFPVLRHLRTDFPVRDMPDPSGLPFLVFENSAYLDVSGPFFHGAGAKGFYRIHGPAKQLRFHNIRAHMAGRVIETDDTAEIDGLSVSNCTAYGVIRGFARFHGLSNALFDTLDLDAAGVDGGGTRVCQLISVVRGTDLKFRNVHLRNGINLINAEERGSTYVQGDGVVLEEETSHASFENCHARDMGDAGFDLKCDGITLEQCSTARCKYGVRIWRARNENRLVSCHFSQPTPRPKNAAACLWVGGRASLEACHLKSAPGTSAIRFGKGPDTKERQVIMKGGDIDLSEGSTLLAGEPGQLVLDHVRLNGSLTTGIARWTGTELLRG